MTSFLKKSITNTLVFGALSASKKHAFYLTHKQH